MTDYRLQLVTINDDGSAVVSSWEIPAEEADRIRSLLPEPDNEGFAPAEIVSGVVADWADGVIRSD